MRQQRWCQDGKRTEVPSSWCCVQTLASGTRMATKNIARVLLWNQSHTYRIGAHYMHICMIAWCCSSCFVEPRVLKVKGSLFVVANDATISWNPWLEKKSCVAHPEPCSGTSGIWHPIGDVHSSELIMYMYIAINKIDFSISRVPALYIYIYLYHSYIYQGLPVFLSIHLADYASQNCDLPRAVNSAIAWSRLLVPSLFLLGLAQDLTVFDMFAGHRSISKGFCWKLRAGYR